MQTKTAGLISASMAGALLFTGVAISASSGTTHGPAKSADAFLASYTAPTINLDNCPTLAIGYQGGCVNQLQTELNAIDGANLSVDGTFGSGTQAAVETFQQENGISPADGIVGPQTKAALDNPVSDSVATPSPGAPIAAAPATGTSAGSGGDSGISGILDGAGVSGWDIVTGVGCGLLGVGVGVVATPPVGVGASIACGLGAVTPPA
jgi:peptidoglycan hydrolase-like protein with peptidoglycan-binding domain